jgi:hypothetical protein
MSKLQQIAHTHFNVSYLLSHYANVYMKSVSYGTIHYVTCISLTAIPEAVTMSQDSPSTPLQ